MKTNMHLYLQSHLALTSGALVVLFRMCYRQVAPMELKNAIEERC